LILHANVENKHSVRLSSVHQLRTALSPGPLRTRFKCPQCHQGLRGCAVADDERPFCKRLLCGCGGFRCIERVLINPFLEPPASNHLCRASMLAALQAVTFFGPAPKTLRTFKEWILYEFEQRGFGCRGLEFRAEARRLRHIFGQLIVTKGTSRFWLAHSSEDRVGGLSLTR
jgi:hypothetical protein